MFAPGLAGAGLASVFGTAQPLFVLAAGPWLLGEALTRRNAFALALGVSGLALVVLPTFSSPDASRFGAGATLALASSAGIALGTIVVRRLQPGAPILTLTAWQLVFGSLPLWAASWALEGTIATSWSLAFIAILAFLAIGGRDYARVDVMVQPDGHPMVLEVNTLPGMTETSLLPKAAAAAGLGYEALCQKMVDLALQRAVPPTTTLSNP